MNKLIVLLILAISCNALGQEQVMAEIFPASPTASELGKFGSYPMDMTTGLPQIEIPLYTIEVGDLSVPIKLKYHASGIRVNQMPSWVGLGWSLDTGGLISLDVRDTPDELEPNPYSIPSSAYIQNNIFSYPYNFENEHLKNLINNSWIKDGYHISLPTVSGTFFLGSTNSLDGIEKFPPDKYLVKKDVPSSSGIPGAPYNFLITDKQGVQYFFKDVEQSEMLKTSSQPRDDIHIYNKKYTSAWLPNRISDTRGNSINFIYGNTYTVPSFGETHSQTYSYSEGQNGGLPFYNASIQQWKVGLSKSLNYANKPTEINFPGGRMRFVTGSNSVYEGVKDGPGLYLQKIIVEKGNSTSGYSLVKTILFEYSVTGAVSLSGKYRFKLDRVIEWQGLNANEQKEIASFEYSTVELPKIGSYSVDFFGLYNGKSNTNLIPSTVIEYKPTQYGGTTPKVIGAGDRSINIALMKAGILTKITYPTKGYTTFEYEPNSYYGYSQTLQKEYITESVALFGEGNGFQNPANILCFDDTCVIKSQQVSLPANTSSTLRITGNSVCSDCNNMNSKFSYAKVWLNGNLIFNGYQNNIDFSVSLPAGNNSLHAEVYGDRVTLHLNMGYWNSPAPGSYKNIEGFGLRNNKITNYDKNGMFLGQKSYKFSIPGTTNSSGKLINGNSEFENVTDFNSSILETCWPNLTYTNTQFFTHSSSSKRGFENNSITYEYVTEIEKDISGNSNGKVVYQFSTFQDLTTSVPSLWQSQSHKRGKLLKKEVFDQQGKILLKEENFYSEDPLAASSRSDFHAQNSVYSDYDINNCGGLIPYNIQNSLQLFDTDFTSKWYKKYKSEVTEFFYVGSAVEEVKRSTDYQYDSNNQEVEEIVQTDSKGNVIKTRYSYAHDKSNQRLIEENRIAVPLETNILKNTEVLESKGTNYSPFGSLYLPKAVFKKKGAVVDLFNLADKTFTYKRYSSTGNPLEVEYSNGPTLVFIWNKDGQLPIAEIKNATYAEVASALGVNSVSLDSFDETNLSVINNLRTSLPKAMVTTYTYEPLIGITSITDPKGDKITYHYDIFNRFQYIRDVDSKILKEYKYNYSN